MVLADAKAALAIDFYHLNLLIPSTMLILVQRLLDNALFQNKVRPILIQAIVAKMFVILLLPIRCIPKKWSNIQVNRAYIEALN